MAVVVSFRLGLWPPKGIYYHVVEPISSLSADDWASVGQ